MFGCPPLAVLYGFRMAEPGCPGCRQRDALITELQRQVADLAARVRDLEHRPGANSSHSPLPPSAHPPPPPKPATKKPRGRRRGGQPGHEPHLRLRLPPERLAQVIDFR